MNESLHSLETGGFVEPLHAEPELEYIFRHAMMHDAAYYSLVKPDRKRLHLMIGDLLERASPARADELAPVLAHHFAEAGDEARAFRYFRQAGDVAAGKNANVEAVAHYTEALAIATARPAVAEPPALLSLFSRRGRALEVTGRFDEALANYEQMLRSAHESHDRRLELAALMSLAILFTLPFSKHDVERAHALSVEAFALAQGLGDEPAQARILWNQMQMARTHNFSDLPRALEYGEQSLAIARRLNLQEQLAFTLNDISELYVFLGETGRARAVLLEANQLWRALNNLSMLADNLSRFSGLLVWCAEYEAAIASAEEAYAITSRIHDPWGISFSGMFMGTAHIESGRVDLALASMHETVNLSERSGYLAPQVVCRTELARVYADMGAVSEARSVAQLAMSKIGPMFELFGAGVMGTLAHVQLQAGDVPAAQAALHGREIPPMTWKASPIFSGMYFVALAEVALAQHDDEGALSIAEEFLDRHVRFGIRCYYLPALVVKARAQLALRRQAEALSTLLAAYKHAEQWKAHWSLWQVLAELAECEAAAEQDADAILHHRQARRLVEQFAGQLPDAALRESFLARPVVRALFN